MNLQNDDELLHYIRTEDPGEMEALFAAARKVRSVHCGQDVYFRGLIEFSNYCKNGCYYCGIRGEFPDHAITLSIGERSRESYGSFLSALPHTGQCFSAIPPYAGSPVLPASSRL
jgi:2-iminoacetate synthase ThiH